ncbi:hypothetical protein [Craterilacuibacter sp.]|uniref:hypothetical protein n=1 Tax=Craterilacuibacter sp. TaxID=2870909 RepID=UPI003F2CF856
MKKSNYFWEINSAYSAEIDDLASNSEGKNVLAIRLEEKRMQIDSLLQMAEFAPEMVIPVFHQAFSFAEPAVLARAARCEPDDDDFPLWDDLAETLKIAPWAAPLVEQALCSDGGELFMVTAAVAEFLRSHDLAGSAASADAENGSLEDEDDDAPGDLGEAGADWLSEQGFDSAHS